MEENGNSIFNLKPPLSHQIRQWAWLYSNSATLEPRLICHTWEACDFQSHLLNYVHQPFFAYLRDFNGFNGQNCIAQVSFLHSVSNVSHLDPWKIIHFNKIHLGAKISVTISVWSKTVFISQCALVYRVIEKMANIL